MINLYGFFIFIGIIFCLISLFFFRKFLIKNNLLNKNEKNFFFEDYYPIFKNLYLFSFFGGKIFFYLFHYDNSWNNLYDFFSYGFSMFGASFFGLSYYFYVLKKYKNYQLLNYLPMFVLIIHAFGRIGCYYAGCCGGYFNGYPIQIISSIWYFFLFIIFFTLIFIFKKKFVNFFKNKYFFFLLLFTFILIVSLERILFDKYRFDCIYLNKYFSFYQLIGILYILFFLILSLIFYKKKY